MKVLACDLYHHNYHYQSSAQYLWLARTLLIIELTEEAKFAYKKAIFQDHFNQEALNGLNSLTVITTPPQYDKHPIYDSEFQQSIGEIFTEETQIHDQATNLYLENKLKSALKLLDKNHNHSNSYFLKGKCHFALRNYEQAVDNFRQAIELSHEKHNEYHIFASDQHLKRGQDFFQQGEVDLAIADFSKSLDLYSKNQEAIRARADAYQIKGNLRLAELDQANLLSTHYA